MRVGKLTLMGGMLMLAAVLGATASPVGGTFSGRATLRGGGQTVTLGGTTPACRRGERVALSVRVAQIHRTAAGTWPVHACTGRPLGWQATLSVGRGAKMGIGAATGYAAATVRRGRRTVAIKRWSSKLALRPVPARGPKTQLGDRPIYGGVTFSMGANVKIDIVGGGAHPSSNCTRDETVTSFTTLGTPERHLFQMTAKSGGSCLREQSYSNFKVKVVGPGSEFEGSGTMFLGQVGAGGSYFTSCYSGTPQKAASKRNYVWSGLKCAKTSEWELEITRGE